ncbi:amino acid transporter [Ephemerocybe angulata]|uniref:Amino acid transporter n=1 Tax=Ephemerocybe angulata TaxID=980116 RepID=A0A8H6M9R8_9AGAR|nr:amino acid transporter [Tulosesus angulatus]
MTSSSGNRCWIPQAPRPQIQIPPLFSADDSDDDDDILGDLNTPKPPGTSTEERHVAFQDPPRVPPRSSRWAVASREAEFELDSDELDDQSQTHLDQSRVGGQSTSDQRMPLLVGLYDTSTARRSLDASVLPMRSQNGTSTENIDLEELSQKRTAGGGLIDGIANMANSILGAGIIGLPYAVRQAGFVTGLILLVSICAMTDWTIRLIVRNAKLSGRSSYIDVMDQCFGKSGRAAVSIFQFAFAFGGMCAFGIIIGDTIPHVIRSAFPKLATIPIVQVFTYRKFMIAFCTICISYPLSLYRDIHKLSRASGLALVGMLIIVISVLIEGPHVPPASKGDPSERFTIVNPGVFQAIGVISFAFVCHHNSLMIYGSLRTPTLDRFSKVTHISTFVSLVACMTLAISAYVIFTDQTQGNILNNFPEDDTLINVARFAFGLNMFTTLPLELFVCREVIEDYFFSHESFSPQRHLFFTTTILLSAMFVSLITCDLGGVSATALAFIFPAACYYKLLGPSNPWYHRSKLPALLCVLFGAVVMVISLALALSKTWTTTEGSAKLCM